MISGSDDASLASKGDPLRERVGVYVDDCAVAVATEPHGRLLGFVLSHVGPNLVPELAVIGRCKVVVGRGECRFHSLAGVGAPLLDEQQPVVPGPDD